MRLIMALILCLTVSSAFAADGLCKEFVIWNPSTKDTLFWFHRNADDKNTKDGDCRYDTGWSSKVVEWHCSNMYLTQDGKSSFMKNHEGSISLNPYQFYCRSRWW